jgi:hypothetical protein
VNRLASFKRRLIFAAAECGDHVNELASADRFGNVHLIARRQEVVEEVRSLEKKVVPRRDSSARPSA